MVSKKIVGQVTEAEKKEIQSLFERRNALAELAKIVDANNDTMYEKLVKDMGETNTKFQLWWDRMSQTYKWESDANGNWEINFDTNEIYLVCNGCSTCNCE
ncbi:MAG: CXXX repeat peptide modification system protein [Bacteroidales bacterium]|nr:CXXX repeat peptide modification system protein [Candidatus Scybalocola fimicaballi]